MKIIICGAGEVGSHAAETLVAKGTRIVVIDQDASRLAAIEESMDVATFRGNCAHAQVLLDAGCADADLVVAATSGDELNLLTASVAKGLGAKKSIARVHHSEYFEQRRFRYEEHLRVDRLICPEYSTAVAIARTLRNPGALAIEGLARGAIEMQEFPVSRKATAIGKSLVDLALPRGTRLAVITRKGGSFIPEAATTIEEEDTVILVGNTSAFPDARLLFHDDKRPRQRVALMGGTPIAVWLARSLRNRDFSIRIFETDRERAEELAEKLTWTTVINADPTDRIVFDEERLAELDVFIGVLNDDETNIIGSDLAKLRGVPTVITVVQHSKFLDVIFDIGIDKAFSPRIVAGNEIESVMDESPLRHLGSLAAGIIDVYRVRIAEKASVLGRPLRDVKLSPAWVVAAIVREKHAFVPGADDVFEQSDTVLVVGRHGEERTLKRLFR
jgi:trk system potassium uptake protein TrkA